MNINKINWIKKPENIDFSLHTVFLKNSEEALGFFILGEDGELSFWEKGEAEEAGYVFLHTPNDWIYFSNNEVKGEMFTLPFYFPLGKSIKGLKVKKGGENISFSDEDNNLLLALSHPSFFSSSSIGFYVKESKNKEIIIF